MVGMIETIEIIIKGEMIELIIKIGTMVIIKKAMKVLDKKVIFDQTTMRIIETQVRM